MKTIALATSSVHSALTEDDQSLIQTLAERGIQAKAAVWTDPDFSWGSVDGVVIRSCWDYHLKLGQFLEWIASLQRAGVRVWNAPQILLWNSNKTYLCDLERKGVPIIPTLWPEPGFRLKDKLIEAGWQAAVIKPRVSATAHRTRMVSAENASDGQPLLDELIENPGAMVQQFIESVRTKLYSSAMKSCDVWNYHFTELTGVNGPDPANGCYDGSDRNELVSFDKWFNWMLRIRE